VREHIDCRGKTALSKKKEKYSEYEHTEGLAGNREKDITEKKVNLRSVKK